MSKIGAILVIMDSIYQLWGNPVSTEWKIFYNMIPYIGLALLFIREFILSRHRKLVLIPFIAYFVFIIIYQLGFIGMDYETYKHSVNCSGPVYTSPFVILAIILIFVLVKWKKR